MVEGEYVLELFRICKNKGGYFKIQMWHPAIKILFIKFKGKWKDSCFLLHSPKCLLFHTFEGAEEAIGVMMEADKKSNKEWVVTKGEI